MDYSLDLAIEFWNQFDNTFMKTNVPKKVVDAYNIVFEGGFDRWVNRWREHRRLGTYPHGFIQEISSIGDKILFLANMQLTVMDLYFDRNSELERRAFEDFGQGILFDSKHSRGGSDHIHKMDIVGPERNPPRGYRRWHVFIQCIVFAGGDSSRWLDIDRYVGLAWAIQSEMKPEDDNPNNPEISSDRLAELRTLWLARDFTELDTAFERYPLPDSPVVL
jgi:hypothetical protein